MLIIISLLSRAGATQDRPGISSIARDFQLVYPQKSPQLSIDFSVSREDSIRVGREGISTRPAVKRLLKISYFVPLTEC